MDVPPTPPTTTPTFTTTRCQAVQDRAVPPTTNYALFVHAVHSNCPMLNRDSVVTASRRGEQGQDSSWKDVAHTTHGTLLHGIAHTAWRILRWRAHRTLWLLRDAVPPQQRALVYHHTPRSTPAHYHPFAGHANRFSHLLPLIGRALTGGRRLAFCRPLGEGRAFQDVCRAPPARRYGR